MQLNAARLLVALCATLSLAGARRVKQRQSLQVANESQLEDSEGDACCCEIIAPSKSMKTYEATHGDWFRSMHLYADKDKSSEKLGPIPKGSKIWALNENPQSDGWVKIAYVKKGNVGVGFSRYADYRFKFVEEESLRATQCSMKSACGDSDLAAPGGTDEKFCSLLSGMPVPAGNLTTEWRSEAAQLMEKSKEFYIERHQTMTAALPEQLAAEMELLQNTITDLENSGHCLMWPPTCVLKHYRLNHRWKKLKSITREMVKMVHGHEAASTSFQANTNQLLKVDEYRDIANRAYGPNGEITLGNIERKLLEEYFKVFDDSSVGQGFAWAQVKASSTQRKAFCSGKSHFDSMDAQYTWKSPKWWKSMFDSCTDEQLTAEEMASLEHDSDNALDVAAHMKGSANIRTIVASNRGVALLQTEEQQAVASSSFVDSSTAHEQNAESRDAADAMLMFFLLTALGCSSGTAMLGAALAL